MIQVHLRTEKATSQFEVNICYEKFKFQFDINTFFGKKSKNNEKCEIKQMIKMSFASIQNEKCGNYEVL